jgi:hypothetical protein
MPEKLNLVPILAAESIQVKRTRDKLSARLTAEKQLITGTTLAKVAELIRAQHSRNISLQETSVINKKPLSLYAEGVGVKTVAGPRVLAIQERVQKEFVQQQSEYQKYFPPMTIKPLESDS